MYVCVKNEEKEFCKRKWENWIEFGNVENFLFVMIFKWEKKYSNSKTTMNHESLSVWIKWANRNMKHHLLVQMFNCEYFVQVYHLTLWYLMSISANLLRWWWWWWWKGYTMIHLMIRAYCFVISLWNRRDFKIILL